MLAKVKEQDGMMLAKEQDGDKVWENLCKCSEPHLSNTPSSEPHLTTNEPRPDFTQVPSIPT